jgi:hypothetical protein
MESILDAKHVIFLLHPVDDSMRHFPRPSECCDEILASVPFCLSDLARRSGLSL